MYDEEIEKAILYYLIFEQEELSLDDKDFFLQKHKQIFAAIQELKNKKEEVSILSLQQQIKGNNKEIINYISNLAQNVFGTSVEYAYKQLKRLSKKRELMKITEEIKEKVKDEQEIEIYIEKLVKELTDLNAEGEKEETFMDMLVDTANIIEKKINLGANYDNKYLTGIFDLDAVTNGLHPEELTIIGARPGVRENYICITNCK